MSEHPTRSAEPLGGLPAVFAALGDATRLSLFTRLSDGRARSISELARGSHLTRQAITRHLKVMEDAGVVRSVRIGRESRYHFSPDPLAGMKAYLERVTEQWDDALARLQSHVED